MHFNLLLPSLIRADWERIGAAIMWPELWERLEAETAFALSIVGTDAILFISVGEPVDLPSKKAVWAIALVGDVGWRPHANFELLRRSLDELSELGRGLGCSEIRIEMGDRPRWKRPVLTPLGFEYREAGAVGYMKRAILDG